MSRATVLFDPAGSAEVVVRQRYPWLLRLDLSAAHTWYPSWGRLRLSLDVYNALGAAEPIEFSCGDEVAQRDTVRCSVDRTPPVVLPNLGLRASF